MINSYFENDFNAIKKFIDRNSNLNNICINSSYVKSRTLFLALPGSKFDGRDYIKNAINMGAIAIIWEKSNYEWKEEIEINNLPILNLKNYLTNIANYFYKKPSSNLLMIGVTGTNGKSTTTSWINDTLNLLKYKSLMIGTIGNKSKKKNRLTTPDLMNLNYNLSNHIKKNGKSCVLEVSSHALAQGRVDSICFDIAVFTNFSRDHLDYHKSMENYWKEKRKLFYFQGLKKCVLNSDDDYGKILIKDLKKRKLELITYGLNEADITASEITNSIEGTSFKINTPYFNFNCDLPIYGNFNIYNILCVAGVMFAIGEKETKIKKVIRKLKPVIGRMQLIKKKKSPYIFLDYAHSPDSLEKVLQGLRNILPINKKLICLFGCGGNRDVGKRPIMGSIAKSNSDLCVMTSDNPRFESQEKIFRDVLVEQSDVFFKVKNREMAIKKAISLAEEKDIVLISGKGHEDYQEVNGVFYPFSDLQVIKSVLTN